MPTDIKLKNSVTATNAPTSLQQGEVAINITDKKVWVGNAATTPVLLLGSGADGTFTNLTVSGVASFADGTVSLPSITNIGDTNTGIYFPAADTIAFTEGGVESMRITDVGNVAVGQSSSSSQFLVKGSSTGKTVSQFISNDTQTTTMAVWERSDGAVSSRLIYDGTGLFKFGTSTAHPLVFDTNNTERMRIDSAGNVGIGTTGGVYKLDVVGAGAQSIRVASSNGDLATLRMLSSGNNEWSIASDTVMRFRKDATEYMRITSNGNLCVGGTTSTDVVLSQIQSGSTSNTSAGFQILTSTTGTGGLYYGDSTTGGGRYAGYVEYGHTSNAMIFATSEAERMRIDSSGNLLVGDTGSIVTSGKFRVLQTTTDNNYISRIQSSAASGMLGLSIYYSGASPNGTGNVFLVCEDTTTTRMAVRSNGGIANYSANDVNLSDAREKTNIELAGSYLNKICSIPVKTFNYIDQNREEDDGLTLGVIAQDVQAVAPELVMESNWAAKDEPEKMRLSIYQTDLQYALMKAIQELKAELDSVKAELQTLKGA